MQNVEKSDFAYSAKLLSEKFLCPFMENAVDWHKSKCGKVRVKFCILVVRVAPWYDIHVAVENFDQVFHRLGSAVRLTFLDGLDQLVDLKREGGGSHHLLFHSIDRRNDGGVVAVENFTDAGEGHVGNVAD